MKVLLAGAFGNLGTELMKALSAKGCEIVAADLFEKRVEGLEGKYRFVPIDCTEPLSLRGICDGCDTVIAAMSQTAASPRFDVCDIDLQGSLNLFEEAKRAGAAKFAFVSALSCGMPGAETVPVLRAKKFVEDEIRQGGMDYCIFRPAPGFDETAGLFRSVAGKGKAKLLKDFGTVKANPIGCADLAAFITAHLDETHVCYEVGGRETYTLEEMAKLCFEACGKEAKIAYTPDWLYGLGAKLPGAKKSGRSAFIQSSQWNLSHDLVACDQTGEASFAEYIRKTFAAK